MLAIRSQLSTLSASDLECDPTTFHMLCQWKKILIVCQKGINEFQTLCVGFKAVETIKLCYMVLC
jgi:hypothetical protein